MTYEKCCKRFHDGALAENPLQLMRSRFSAYALNKPDYIIGTTHPSNPQYSNDLRAWGKSITQFSKDSKFNRLDILDYNPLAATVTFTAHISQNNCDVSFTEKSYFKKVGKRWLYVSGEFRER